MSKYTNKERKGLPGGPNEIFSYTTGVFSQTPSWFSNGPNMFAQKGKEIIDYGSKEYKKAYDEGTVTSYSPTLDLHVAKNLDAATAKAQAPFWLKAKREFEKNNPKPVEATEGPRKALGIKSAALIEWENKQNEYIVEQIEKKRKLKGRDIEKLNELPIKEQQYLASSPKYQTSYYKDFVDGVKAVTPFLANDPISRIANDENLTNYEKKERLDRYLDNPTTAMLGDAAGILSPLTIPAKMVQAPFMNDYSMENAISGTKGGGNTITDIVTDPLNLSGFGLLAKLGKLSKLNKLSKIGKAAELSKTLNKSEDVISNVAKINQDEKNFFPVTIHTPDSGYKFPKAKPNAELIEIHDSNKYMDTQWKAKNAIDEFFSKNNINVNELPNSQLVDLNVDGYDYVLPEGITHDMLNEFAKYYHSRPLDDLFNKVLQGVQQANPNIGKKLKGSHDLHGVASNIHPEKLGFKNRLEGVPANKYNDVKNAFKSEINWEDWVKKHNPIYDAEDLAAIKQNAIEYNQIEEATKADGTWMKNPDGSSFKGTPEEFIQQRSSKFKKAFPNTLKDESGEIMPLYHSNDAAPEKFTYFDQNKSGEVGTYYGRGQYSTPHLDITKAYGENTKELYGSISNSKDNIFTYRGPNENIPEMKEWLFPVGEIGKQMEKTKYVLKHNPSFLEKQLNSLENDYIRKLNLNSKYTSLKKESLEEFKKLKKLKENGKIRRNKNFIEVDGKFYSNTNFSNAILDLIDSNKSYDDLLNLFDKQIIYTKDATKAEHDFLKAFSYNLTNDGNYKKIKETLSLDSNDLEKTYNSSVKNIKNLYNQEKVEAFNKLNKLKPEYENAISDVPNIIKDRTNIVYTRSGSTPTEVVIPYERPMKSRLGNNGNFDVNNPNFYKALTVPVLGGSVLLNEYQEGSEINKNVLKKRQVSTEGYKRNSPDRFNPYNIIPSGNITMEDVDFPILGIDNYGNKKVMTPGGNYTFPGDTVLEFPIAQKGTETPKYDFNELAERLNNSYDPEYGWDYNVLSQDELKFYTDYYNKSKLPEYQSKGEFIPEWMMNSINPILPIKEAFKSVKKTMVDPIIESLHNEQYTVKPGDNLHKIANKYKMNVDDIIAANNLENPSLIKPNDKIRIPRMEPDVPNKTSNNNVYKVKSGDNLSTIAKANNTSVSEIVKLNEIKNKNVINIGQELKLPEPKYTVIDDIKIKPKKYKDVDDIEKRRKEINSYTKEIKIHDGFNVVNDSIDSENFRTITMPDNERIAIEAQAIEKPNDYFMVVDKTSNMLRVYKGNNLVYETETILGEKRSDAMTNAVAKDTDGDGIITNADKINGKFDTDWSLGNKSTGAGIFQISSVNKTSEYDGAPSINLANERGKDISTSIHLGTPWRESKLGNKFIGDNRMSNGCVNCTRDALEVLSTMNFPKGTKVYVLPEEQGNRYEYVDGQVVMRTSAKNRKKALSYDKVIKDEDGNEKVVNVENKRGIAYNQKTLKYEPIKAEFDEEKFKNEVFTYFDFNDEEEYENTTKPFIEALVKNKKDIMKAAQIPSDVYNQIAKMTFGIYGAESNFGDTHSMVGNLGRATTKFFNSDSSSPDVVSKYDTYGAVEDWRSVGYTQMRWSFLNDREKEALKSLGITSNKDLLDPKKSAIATATVLGIRYNEQLTSDQKEDLWNNLPNKWNKRTNYSDRVKRNSEYLKLYQKSRLQRGGEVKSFKYQQPFIGTTYILPYDMF